MNADRQILLFVVDGMRPDGLQQADTPVMDRLIAEGAATLQAQTVQPAVTLPCHTSMFHGVRPDRHGVVSNTWTPAAEPVPGLVDVIAAAGGTSAVFYTWEQLRDLWRPGALYYSYFHREAHGTLDEVLAHDRELGAVAARYLADHAPAFTFVYLGATDLVGHGDGWMSEPYLTTIADADRIIGHVHDAAAARNGGALTTLVVADHGGHERRHGEAIPEDLTIPWILHGAGVRSGTLENAVSIEDTAPTLAALLGLARPPAWTGRVVAEALTATP